jgi:hypothetical protein
MAIATSLARRSFGLALSLGLLTAGCGAGLVAPESQDPQASPLLAQGVEQPFGDAVRGLCHMALGLPTDWVFAAPPSDYRNSGTPNQKLLWRTWYYGWALRAGTSAQKLDARQFLLDLLTAGFDYGHQNLSDANEVLTASHYQLWAQGVAGARLLAWKSSDSTVLAATGRWWRGEKALYDVLARDESIDAPGARFPDGQAGPNGLRDVVYAQLTGRPLPGRAGTPTSPWWDDKYNAAAWMIRELQRGGDDLGGAGTAGSADLPLLRDPLYVYSRGADYVFVFPQMHGALEPLFWSARIGGVKSYSPYAPGAPTTPAVPAPELSGAMLKVIPGS